MLSFLCIAALISTVLVFLLVRGAQRPKTVKAEQPEKNVKSAGKSSVQSMQRLQTEDCARAIEEGTATNDMANKFRMDYWAMPFRQISRQMSVFSRAETDRSAA
eukprot:Skav226674  [mRNA]  locus=scaffold861:331986:332297:+ [translate_table: standard]